LSEWHRSILGSDVIHHRFHALLYQVAIPIEVGPDDASGSDDSSELQVREAGIFKH